MRKVQIFMDLTNTEVSYRLIKKTNTIVILLEIILVRFSSNSVF